MQPANLCANCHQPLTPGARFCGSCGAIVAETTDVPTAVPGVVRVQDEAAPASPATSTWTQATPTLNAFGATPEPQVTPALAPPTPSSEPAAVQTPTPAPAPSFTPFPSPVSPVEPATQPTYAAQAVPQAQSGTAIASFVLGIVGLVAWLIPVLGLPLGIVGLSLGIRSRKQRKSVFALIGLILSSIVILLSAGNWILGTILYLQDHAIQSKAAPIGSVTPLVAQQSVASPCYTLELPKALTLTQAANSCTVEAATGDNAESIEIKTMNASGATPTTLQAGAEPDIHNFLSNLHGGVLTGEKAETFAGSPSYVATFRDADGNQGTIEYVLHDTAQGNLVIAVKLAHPGTDPSLTDISRSWAWAKS